MSLATVVLPRGSLLVKSLPARAAGVPFTAAVVAALFAVSTFLDLHPAEALTAVGWASTNLNNLGGHPIAAMLTSVFITEGHPWMSLVLVTLGCGVVETRLGVWRTVLIALAGHVIATLLTEYGAAAAAGAHLIAASAPDRSDVGVSYAMYALLGAATLLLPRRLRTPALMLLLADVLVPFAEAPGMTTSGHILSVGCGVGALAAITRSRSGRSSAVLQP